MIMSFLKFKELQSLNQISIVYVKSKPYKVNLKALLVRLNKICFNLL